MALAGDRARRLSAVLRLRSGAEVAVFDGLGHERAARIVETTRDTVLLSLGEAIGPLPECAVPIYVCCAFPRGSRGDWLVEKATELGAHAFVPLEVDRSVMRAGDGRVERWRRIAIEAAEQSGRAVVPEFVGAVAPGALGLVADLQAGLTPREAVTGAKPGASHGAAHGAAAIALYVGPEGGWTAAERAAHGAAGHVGVSLGARPLRVETAAVTLLALVVDALRASSSAAG